MNVCPTKSGVMVQARAQVLIGSALPRSFCAMTRAMSLATTNGPFFVERLIESPRLLPAADDEPVGGGLLAAGLAALRVLAPRRHRMASAGPAAFAAAHRVRDRVLGRAAAVRADAHVAVAAGLADRDVLVVEIADHADRRLAGE